MKEQIKELRVKIDGLVQLLKPISRSYGPLLINMSGAISSEQREKFIKAFRERGNRDFVIHPCEDIKIQPLPLGISHVDESIKSLLLGKAWLGKVLGTLGEESPYKNDGKRKDVEDIEPVADQMSKEDRFILAHDGQDKDWVEKSYIEKIDWLREQIKETLGNIKMRDIAPKFPEIGISAQHLSEARFHLGFELERIREQSAKAEA